MVKRSGLKERSSFIKAALVAGRESDRAGDENASKAKSEPFSSKPVAMNVRLPRELYERARKIAFDQRTSIHALLLEGLEEIMPRYER